MWAKSRAPLGNTNALEGLVALDYGYNESRSV